MRPGRANGRPKRGPQSEQPHQRACCCRPRKCRKKRHDGRQTCAGCCTALRPPSGWRPPGRCGLRTASTSSSECCKDALSRHTGERDNINNLQGALCSLINTLNHHSTNTLRPSLELRVDSRRSLSWCFRDRAASHTYSQLLHQSKTHPTHFGFALRRRVQ